MKLVKLLFLLCLPLLTNAKEFKYKEVKNIKKQQRVNPTDLLYTNNKYGNIKVITWNKPFVDFDINITVEGNDLSDVKTKINNISIDFKQESDTFSAKTVIKKNNSWFSLDKSTNLRIQINYLIKIPQGTTLDLKNTYGNILLPKLTKNVRLNCAYGSLTAERLLGNDNKIKLAYCDMSTINYMNKGTIKSQYSKLKVIESNTINLEADYSETNINTVENIYYNIKYSQLNLTSSPNNEGNATYSTVNIESVTRRLMLRMEYGELRIQKYEAKNNALISSAYSDVKIYFPESYHFGYNIKTTYTDVKMSKPTNITTNKGKNGYYNGYFGGINSSNQLDIKASYGNIILKRK